MNMLKPVFITAFIAMSLYGSNSLISHEHNPEQQHFVESSKAPAGLKGYFIYLLNMIATHKRISIKTLVDKQQCESVKCYQSNQYMNKTLFKRGTL